MFSWKEKPDLKRQLQELQGELEKEQGKATRLAGYLARLQAFGVSPTGDIPRRAFGETLMDTVHTILKCSQAVFLYVEPVTGDWVPESAIGLAPQILSHLRVHEGEGVLGRAAQNLKLTAQLAPAAGTPPSTEFLNGPHMIAPLASQAQCLALLVVAQPESGSFSVEDRSLFTLIAAQAVLVIEDHNFYERLQGSRDQAVESLLRALEVKDSVTHRHSDRTRALVRALTQEMTIPEVLIEQIELGALLHDIGKIGIEDAILKKTSELTTEEYAIMKTHSVMGRKILEPLAALRPVVPIVLYHQEWYNGAGYPDGLAGEEIPLGARVVQIIDAWDAMTSNRPYRKAIPRSSAIAELRRQAGSQFDPKLVDLFLRVIDRLEREGIATTEQSSEKAVAARRA